MIADIKWFFKIALLSKNAYIKNLYLMCILRKNVYIYVFSMCHFLEFILPWILFDNLFSRALL